MARHKRSGEVHQHKFNLSDDSEDEKRLHDYLLALAQEGKKSAWIVDKLVDNLPAAPRTADKVKVGKVVAEVRYDAVDE